MFLYGLSSECALWIGMSNRQHSAPVSQVKHSGSLGADPHVPTNRRSPSLSARPPAPPGPCGEDEMGRPLSAAHWVFGGIWGRYGMLLWDCVVCCWRRQRQYPSGQQ